MTDRCKVEVTDHHGWGSHRCYRKPTRDGYCTQHHPDSVRARREKQAVKYEAERKRSSSYLLRQARKQIEAVREQILLMPQSGNGYDYWVAQLNKALEVSGD